MALKTKQNKQELHWQWISSGGLTGSSILCNLENSIKPFHLYHLLIKNIEVNIVPPQIPNIRAEKSWYSIYLPYLIHEIPWKAWCENKCNNDSSLILEGVSNGFKKQRKKQKLFQFLYGQIWPSVKIVVLSPWKPDQGGTSACHWVGKGGKESKSLEWENSAKYGWCGSGGSKYLARPKKTPKMGA